MESLPDGVEESPVVVYGTAVTSVPLPPDIRNLHDQLEATAREAQQLVAGLSTEQGAQAPGPGRWSVSECLDQLATGNRVYLAAMKEPAARARAQGHLRRRPATPGVLAVCSWYLPALARAEP